MEQPHSDPRRSDPQMPPPGSVDEPSETGQRSHKAAVYSRPLIDRKLKYTLYALLIGALLLLFFLEPLIHMIQGWGNN